jgi:molecular chaperone DnaK
MVKRIFKEEKVKNQLQIRNRKLRIKVSMIFQTEKLLKDMNDKLEPADKSKIEASLNTLKEINGKISIDTITEANIEELKKAKEDLTSIFYEISQKVYSQAGANAGDVNAHSASSNDDDVIDADFKEE